MDYDMDILSRRKKTIFSHLQNRKRVSGPSDTNSEVREKKRKEKKSTNVQESESVLFYFPVPPG